MPAQTTPAEPQAEEGAVAAVHDPEMLPVLQDICGEWRSSIVSTLAFLQIGDALDGNSKTIHELAMLTNTEPESLYRLLRCAAAMGYAREVMASETIELSQRLFAGTPRTRYLNSKAPESLYATALMMHSGAQASAWHRLTFAVQTGETVLPDGETYYSYLESRPDEAEIFNRAMSALSWDSEVADACDFSDTTTVVDVGGGVGRLIAEVLSRHPELNGILIDQPQAAKEAEEFLERKRVLERCRVVAADFLVDLPKLPKNSAVVLKFILHNWRDHDAVKILKTVRSAMPSAGRLIIADPVLPEHDIDAYPAMLDLLMLLLFGGRERTLSEQRKLLNESGFRFERHIPLLPQMSLIEATAA